MSSSLSHFFEVGFTLGRMKQTGWGKLTVSAQCTDGKWCLLEDSVSLHSSKKKSPVSWIIYKPLVHSSLFRAGWWTESGRFAQRVEGRFVTIKTAIPKACFCLHKWKWLSHFKENDFLIFLIRKKKDIIILQQDLRQERDSKRLIVMFSFQGEMEVSLVVDPKVGVLQPKWYLPL